MAIPTHIGTRDPSNGTYNPGIQTNIAPVTRDNEIYADFVAGITEDCTLGSGNEKFEMDLFGRSPLSGMIAFWNTNSEVTILVESKTMDSGANTYEQDPVSYTYTGLASETIIALPILGFAASDYAGSGDVTVTDGDGKTFSYTIVIDPLPASDKETGNSRGFPITDSFESTIESVDSNIPLYFVCLCEGRYNVGYDYKGNVRWYVCGGQDTMDEELQLPTFNPQRLSDGTWLGVDDHLVNYYNPSADSDEPDGMREIWRFDMTGRVLSIYFIRDRNHHSIHELVDDNKIMMPSEYIASRDAEDGPEIDINLGATCEDCVSIMDLETGYEDCYYDMRKILNFARLPRPQDTAVPLVYDWAHINQAYWDSVTNIVVISCRHQGIIGIDRNSGALRFIMANHDDWNLDEENIETSDWTDLLLTPINPETGDAYDLTDEDEKTDADLNFWTWGQHNVSQIERADGETDENILEFGVFNNGNYRTRDGLADGDTSYGVLPPDNHSSAAKFRIDLENMTVEKTFEYGEKIGSDGYSSYVSTASFLSQNTGNDTLLINFGGTVFADNSTTTPLPVTLVPGQTDAVDENDDTSFDVEGKVLLEEIDMTSDANTVLFHLHLRSGLYKTAAVEGGIRRAEFYSFRAHKGPIYV